MDGDLRLIDLSLLFFFFHYASVSHGHDLFDFEFVEDSQGPVGMGPQ